LQGPIVAFIEAPGVLNRNPHPIEFVEDDPEGPDRPFENGGEGEVEAEPFGLQDLPGGTSLAQPLLGEVDIGPPGKPVLPIPIALPVTNKNKFIHE
jgi:hypothetical protein